MKNFPISIGFIVAFAFASGTAHAAQELILKTDQTQLLTLSAAPGAAIVGNPSIADVTVHGQQLFVHGKLFGETNLIILDVEGNQLANFDIAVQNNSNNGIAVYKAGSKYSFTCAPTCEAILQVGDNKDWNSDMTTEHNNKNTAAMGASAPTAAAAPPPPQ